MARKGKVVIANDFQVKTGATPAWVTLGKGVTFQLVRKDTQGKITYVDGEEEMFKSGEQRFIKCEVADQTVAAIDLIEGLSGLSRPFFFKLGVCNSKGQDMYITEGTLILDTDWKSPSSNGLNLGFIIQPTKQSAPVSVTPSTGLPSSAYSTAVSDSQTSTINYHWLIIETAV